MWDAIENSETYSVHVDSDGEVRLDSSVYMLFPCTFKKEKPNMSNSRVPIWGLFDHTDDLATTWTAPQDLLSIACPLNPIKELKG